LKEKVSKRTYGGSAAVDWEISDPVFYFGLVSVKFKGTTSYMNYAVIDLGSNSVRLSVYEYTDGQIRRIFNQKEMAGLAGYIANGILNATGVQKACAVIGDFKETAFKFVESSNLYLFATAAIRNCKNRDAVVAAIVEETGVVPNVLDGEEEAALSFIGASRFTDCENGVMIDIGGASTELVLFRDHGVVTSIRLPIGCLNLSIEHVGKIVPKESEWKKIEAAVKEQFAKVDWGKDLDCPLMVGVGGTLRAVLKLSGAIYGLPARNNEIKPFYVKEIIKLLKDNRSGIYHEIYRITPERLMTISTGLTILQQAIKKFKCETITVSRFGVREGYLMDRVLMNNEKYNIDEGSRED